MGQVVAADVVSRAIRMQMLQSHCEKANRRAKRERRVKVVNKNFPSTGCILSLIIWSQSTSDYQDWLDTLKAWCIKGYRRGLKYIISMFHVTSALLTTL